MKFININVENREYKYSLGDYKEGIKLEEIAKENEDFYKGNISLAIINHKLRDLDYIVRESCDIKFLDTTTEDGMKVYFRTLSFVFIVACKELFDNCDVMIEHSLCKGLYSEIKIGRDITEEDVKKIKEKMNQIINEDIKIEKYEIEVNEAIKMFKEYGRYKKAKLLKYKKDDSTKIYKCHNYVDYFYGYLLPRTSNVRVFDIKKYKDGVIVLAHDKNDKNKVSEFVEQPKLANIYKEAEEWSNLLGVDSVVSLNQMIEDKKYSEVIRIVESLHEKKISHIADMIKERNKRVILIAAPSSSGKTSFAHRLSIHLKVNHLNPISISLDDYFVNREDTPLDEYGNYDFECIDAIDLETFNKDLSSLLNGEDIEILRYNFKTGSREYTGKKLKIEENQPIILEGIHGLNPRLTESILEEDKFKIYISALTQINLDNHNRIPTTDLRLIRRIVRDYEFRGYSAEKTINQWASVRRGEGKNIFPYQEEADVMFNSACVYELSILKKYITPLLENIDVGSSAYIEANRLLKFLQYFVVLEDISDIPVTSIIREFIGGSKIVH